MKLNRMITALAGVLLLLTNFSSATKAQTDVTGGFEGLVVDSVTHTPIQGASVKILNELTKAEKTTRTDIKGRFNLTSLPPGEYRIQFSALGYLSREIVRWAYATRFTEVTPSPFELDPSKPPEKQVQDTGGIAVAAIPNALVQVESLEDESIFKRMGWYSGV